MDIDLGDMRNMFLKKVKEFKLKLYSSNKFVRISCKVSDLKFIFLETLLAFIVFTPLFLLFFSPGVILLSNFVDVLFLSFICSSLSIVLPANVILTFLGRSAEKNALKEEKDLLELSKNIINSELLFLQQSLDSKVDLQKNLSETELIDLIIEDSGERLAYGPRELIFSIKNHLNFIIMDTEFFDDQYGRFLVFKFILPFKFEKSILTVITVSNDEKDEVERVEKEETPEWYDKLVFLLKSHINLSISEKILLRLEDNKLEVVICEYRPLGSLGYSQFLQELKKFVCEEFGCSRGVD